MSASAPVHMSISCPTATSRLLAPVQIGLMLANLLGIAGVNVVVLEKNDGLVGLPRAIAYDPETLRLFAQVGLFDRIGRRARPGPAGRLSQRSQRQTHGDNFATKRVRLFPAWHFLPAALRTGACSDGLARFKSVQKRSV